MHIKFQVIFWHMTVKGAVGRIKKHLVMWLQISTNWIPVALWRLPYGWWWKMQKTQKTLPRDSLSILGYCRNMKVHHIVSFSQNICVLFCLTVLWMADMFAHRKQEKTSNPSSWPRARPWFCANPYYIILDITNLCFALNWQNCDWKKKKWKMKISLLTLNV